MYFERTATMENLIILHLLRVMINKGKFVSHEIQIMQTTM